MVSKAVPMSSVLVAIVHQGEVHGHAPTVVGALREVGHVAGVRQVLPEELLGLGRAVAIEDLELEPSQGRDLHRLPQTRLGVPVQQAARGRVDRPAR